MSKLNGKGNGKSNGKGRQGSKRTKRKTQDMSKFSHPIYSFEQFSEALKKSFGKIAIAARSLGCERKTIYDAMQRFPKLAEIGKEAKEFIYDFAELKLFQKVQEGDLDAIDRLLLHTVEGRNRGYAKRIEYTGAEGQPIQLADRKAEISGFLDRLARIASARTEKTGTGAAQHGPVGSA